MNTMVNNIINGTRCVAVTVINDQIASIRPNITNYDSTNKNENWDLKIIINAFAIGIFPDARKVVGRHSMVH